MVVAEQESGWAVALKVHPPSVLVCVCGGHGGTHINHNLPNSQHQVKIGKTHGKSLPQVWHRADLQ